jgi:hypothetical protein
MLASRPILRNYFPTFKGGRVGKVTAGSGDGDRAARIGEPAWQAGARSFCLEKLQLPRLAVAGGEEIGAQALAP